MHDYVDPSGRAEAARIALIVYLVAQVGEMTVAVAFGGNEDVVGIASLILLLAMVAAMVATSFWVHRVSVNANGFADGLTITPGWAIGWYFVPIANLWKPFEAMTEIWRAGEWPEEWPRVPVPGLLRAWWGCWLGGNILGGVSARLSSLADPSLAVGIDLVSSALLLAAGVMLIRIIAAVSRQQPVARAERAFA